MTIKRSTHGCLINAQNLIHILVYGKQQSIPLRQLISVLRLSGQQRPLILRQPLLKLTHPRSERSQLRFSGPWTPSNFSDTFNLAWVCAASWDANSRFSACSLSTFASRSWLFPSFSSISFRARLIL